VAFTVRVEEDLAELIREAAQKEGLPSSRHSSIFQTLMLTFYFCLYIVNVN
jgi:hypothetical protein